MKEDTTRYHRKNKARTGGEALNILEYLYSAMGWILKELYLLLGKIGPFFENYALAILLFTVLVNAVFLPINFHQQKVQARQTAIRPKLDDLKKKYGNDRQKYSMEMQALYQRENVKMMGGCLPMLIRLPFLWGVWQAISRPLSFFINIGQDAITQAREYLVTLEGFTNRAANTITELDILHNIDLFQTQMPDLYERAKDVLNFDLFGIDLTQTPKFTLNFASLTGEQLALWLIPLLSFATAMLSSVISMQMQKKTNPDAGNMGMIMLTMPIISLVIAFGVPAAVGFYWACSNVVMTVIQFCLNKWYSPYTIIAREEAKNIAKRREKEKTKMNKEVSAAN